MNLFWRNFSQFIWWFYHDLKRFIERVKQLRNMWIDSTHDSSENHENQENFIFIQFMIQIAIVYKSASRSENMETGL